MARAEEIREIFQHYDKDRNGFIDPAEFAALCRALDPSFPDEEITLGLGVVDRNGNGRIEYGEFARWWKDR